MKPNSRDIIAPVMKRRIKIGLDFDGVVAYNPFRVARPIVAFVKSKLFGVKKLKFWYPQKRWQQIFWVIIHESSIFPANGVELLKKLVREEKIEAHLITARYSFLDNHLYNWLDKYKIRKLFKTINMNKQDEQPHLFKEKLIDRYKLDYYIEDNLDIVKHLVQKNKKNIYWIYNLLDRSYPYPKKYPYLQKALIDIQKSIDLR